jgi:hypothetical protein
LFTAARDVSHFDYCVGVVIKPRFDQNKSLSLSRFQEQRVNTRQIDNIAAYYACCVTNRRVLDWMIGFVDALFTQLATTGNTTVSLFTVAHTVGFSAFTSLVLVTNL